MLTEDDIQSYIRLCRFLGSYKDLVQGSGGNISVKSEDQICIKSSGRLLSETSRDNAYVVCDRNALQELYAKRLEDTRQTVLYGETKGTPSMEVFFHLLPSKWVVHLHPTWLLKYLCQEGWQSLTLDGNLSCTYVPYTTPGLPLADAIFASQPHSSLYFLQNHGLIVCADTIEDVLSLLDIVHNQCSKKTTKLAEYSTMYAFVQNASKLANTELILRPCSIVRELHDRLFLPITPDISLFLKHMPLAQESSCESLESHLITYWKQFETYPAVVKRLDRVYVLGKSITHCICIEDLLAQYLEITRTVDPNRLTMFSNEVLFALKTSEKEVQRLNIV